MTKTKSFLLLAFALLFAACGGDSDDPLVIREKFEGKTEQFAKLPAKTELAPEASIKGKLLVLVNTGFGYAFDDVSAMDLKAVFAHRPEDVGTVALIDCKKEKAGTYVSQNDPSKQADAFKSRCELNLVDHKAQTVFFRRTFEAELPQTARGQGNYVFAGSETQLAIKDFLKSLIKK